MSKITILKKALSASYCGKTLYDFLDEDEITGILKAMDEYADSKIKRFKTDAIHSMDDAELEDKIYLSENLTRRLKKELIKRRLKPQQ